MHLVFKIYNLTFDILFGSWIFFVFCLPLSRGYIRSWTSTAVVISILFSLFLLCTCLTFVVGVPGVAPCDRLWSCEVSKGTGEGSWIGGWGSTSYPPSDKGSSASSPCVAWCPRCIWTRCTGTSAGGSISSPGWLCLVSDIRCSICYPFIGIFWSRRLVGWSRWCVILGALFMDSINFYDRVTWRVESNNLVVIESWLILGNVIPSSNRFCMSLKVRHVMVKHCSQVILIEEGDNFWLVLLVSYQTNPC